VTYDDIAAIFLAPLAEPIAEPDVARTPARLLRDALEPIATQGWWSRPAGETLTALGVDFFPGYVWGRAAALGTPTAAVVTATFGVFEPGMITAAYETGLSSASRDDILAARAGGAAASLDAIADDAECDAIARPLLAAIAGLDGLGRPLFSALRSLPLPSTPGGRLWRAAELVREHRGDGHLAALAVAGLGAVEANVLTERWLGFGLGEYSATRGFAPQALADGVRRLERRGWMRGEELTESGRDARAAIEASTDAGQRALVEACGDALAEITARAAEISVRLVEARAFPADPRKRAGG
jgi:Helix-turn-helix family